MPSKLPPAVGLPSKKATCPAANPWLPETSAVKVTDWPYVEVAVEAETVVIVGNGRAVRTTLCPPHRRN